MPAREHTGVAVVTGAGSGTGRTTVEGRAHGRRAEATPLDAVAPGGTVQRCSGPRAGAPLESDDRRRP